MEYVIYKDHEASECPLSPHLPLALAQKDHQLPIRDHDTIPALTFRLSETSFPFVQCRKCAEPLQRAWVLKR